MMKSQEAVKIKTMSDVELAYRRLRDDVVQNMNKSEANALVTVSSALEKTTSATEIDIITLPFESLGGSVTLTISCKFKGFGYLKLYRGSTEVWSSTIIGWIGAGAEYTPVQVTVTDVPDKGQHEYRLAMVYYDATHGSVSISQVTLTGVEQI